MKLSFSIQNWDGIEWQEFCDVAKDTKMKGVEMYDLESPIFRGKSTPTNPEYASATRRHLQNAELSIPCIDTVADFTDADFLSEFTEAMEVAVNLGIPSISVHTTSADHDTNVEALTILKEMSEDFPVAILVETTGTYADTGLLRELLNEFADDQELAACWNMYATCAEGNEDAETTITNLGAYVHHVHIHDYHKVAGDVSPELIGEGELPLKELMNALRSVNYDGFISLQWDPAWIEGIDDIEIILTHFHSCMRRYRPTRYNLKHLQWNKAHTGRYVWEKEKLIDKTFPEVLDRMVEEFPDQTGPRVPGRQGRQQGHHLGHQRSRLVPDFLGRHEDRRDPRHHEHRLQDPRGGVPAPSVGHPHARHDRRLPGLQLRGDHE